MNILHTLGLIKRSEHEVALAKTDNAAYNSWIKVINERDLYVSEYKALEAKFKSAALTPSPCPGDGMRELRKALRDAPDPVFNPSEDWLDLYAEWHQETRDLGDPKGDEG